MLSRRDAPGQTRLVHEAAQHERVHRLVVARRCRVIRRGHQVVVADVVIQVKVRHVGGREQQHAHEAVELLRVVTQLVRHHHADAHRHRQTQNQPDQGAAGQRLVAEHVQAKQRHAPLHRHAQSQHQAIPQALFHLRLEGSRGVLLCGAGHARDRQVAIRHTDTPL
jgi:hypothetical protein